MIGVVSFYQTAGTASASPPPINSAFDYFVVHVLSNTALLLSLSILIVGIAALVLQFRLFKARPASSFDILRMSAVTMIITFSLALAAFLDSAELKEASPIFGLFSTIAGYLLGASQGRTVGGSTAHDQSPTPASGEGV